MKRQKYLMKKTQTMINTRNRTTPRMIRNVYKAANILRKCNVKYTLNIRIQDKATKKTVVFHINNL